MGRKSSIAVISNFQATYTQSLKLLFRLRRVLEGGERVLDGGHELRRGSCKSWARGHDGYYEKTSLHHHRARVSGGRVVLVCGAGG